MPTKLEIYRTLVIYAQYDPTRTGALRSAFANEMKRRFNELAKVVVKTVDTEDAFGLRQTNIGANQMQSPPRASFAFPRSQDKVARFNEWLNKQVNAGILDIKEFEQVGKSINDAWTNKYVYDSYKRGVLRAKYEAKTAGLKIPDIGLDGGIEISMSTPFHIDRLGLLYTRVYEDLKGITSQMSTQISRVLTQGIADGDNPRVLGRKLKAVINGADMGDLAITDTLGRFIPASRRAQMLARTEIIRAHHQATIQEYRNWSISGVTVQGEWQTAEDGRVCSKCAELQGKIFTLDEIEALIPLHPNCRCVALPVIDNAGRGNTETEIKEDLKNVNITPPDGTIFKELPAKDSFTKIVKEGYSDILDKQKEPSGINRIATMAALSEPNASRIILLNGNKIAGAIAYKEEQSRYFINTLGSLLSAPKNTGSFLVKLILKKALLKNKSVFLNSLEDSKAFYLKLGFTENKDNNMSITPKQIKKTLIK